MAPRIKLTPEEQAEKEAAKTLQKKLNKIANAVKAKCNSEVGLKAMEYQLEFLENNNTELPDPTISRPDNIRGFRLGITRYKESLGNFSQS